MTTRLLSDYIKVYESTLSTERCAGLVERFEAASALHEAVHRSYGADGLYSFVMLNVTTHWPEVNAEIWQIIKTYLHQYHESLGLRRFWPKNATSEAIRLKRYLPNGQDRFDPHVDVVDQSNCARLITAILYLNVPGNGATVFPDLGLAIEPAPGRLVIFPPLWTFVHAGQPPRDRPKYTLQTYLLYPPPPDVK